MQSFFDDSRSSPERARVHTVASQKHKQSEGTGTMQHHFLHRQVPTSLRFASNLITTEVFSVYPATYKDAPFSL